MKNGRRKGSIYGTCLLITGTFAFQLLVFPVHMVGIMLAGAGRGIIIVSQARYIQDYVPNRILPVCLASVAIVMHISKLSAQWSTEMLPPKNDHQALVANSSWRFILGLPVIIGTVALLMQLYIIRTDGPLFYVYKADKDNARKALLKVYKL